MNEYLSLGQAARKIPTASGRPLSTTNLYRWTQTGCRGVVLKSYRFGRRIVTTEGDLEQFASDLAEVYARERQEPPTPRATTRKRTRTAAQRTKAAEAAEARLLEQGVLS